MRYAVSGQGGGAHLQRMFPVQKVRYMYFTGEFIDAQEAWRLGAVERVVPLAPQDWRRVGR